MVGGIGDFINDGIILHTLHLTNDTIADAIANDTQQLILNGFGSVVGILGSFRQIG